MAEEEIVLAKVVLRDGMVTAEVNPDIPVYQLSSGVRIMLAKIVANEDPTPDLSTQPARYKAVANYLEELRQGFEFF